MASHGLVLPPAYVRFLSDPGLQRVVPSCTSCAWEIPAAPVPSRFEAGAFTIRVLRDQQDALFWYLHLGAGGAAVLVSPIDFADPDTTTDPATATWICAPHFEHFVYRFWIENELWETLQEHDPHFSASQRAYLAAYEQLR